MGSGSKGTHPHLTTTVVVVVVVVVIIIIIIITIIPDREIAGAAHMVAFIQGAFGWSFSHFVLIVRCMDSVFYYASCRGMAGWRARKLL
ncbi:hypothetical protein F5Y01DRAFT_271230 [Xylaria sp. FL0043]|nr:hypothetical protein F5Y01DRAFT_271230 [Xylaria sp. FL0043]